MVQEYAELAAVDPARRRPKQTVLESVDEAVAGIGDLVEYATPESALRWLLELAWSDLRSARHHASNGRWSTGCDNQVDRIAGLTRLIGPLPWDCVDVDLILDGVYERIHEALGVPTPLSDTDRQRCRDIKER